MAKYDLLVDGERQARVDSEDALRSWLDTYRGEHEEDDPAATHVQILQRGPFAWLTGGKLLDRDRFH